MEEQSSWKGHTFTLLVFAGIVFLCSVFFVLGMLVGDSHGRSAADAANVAAAAKAAAAAATEAPHPASESASVIAPYEGVETGRSSNTALNPDEPAPAAPAREVKPPTPVPVKAVPPVAAAPVSKPASVPPSVKMNYLQVNALGKESAARKLVDELVKQGFPALFTNGSADKLYHVQVGPFSNGTDEETAKSKLEALGYHVIKK